VNIRVHLWTKTFAEGKKQSVNICVHLWTKTFAEGKKRKVHR
jgi:hypothetical protein